MSIRQGMQDYLVKDALNATQLKATILHSIERHKREVKEQEKQKKTGDFSSDTVRAIGYQIKEILYLNEALLSQSSKLTKSKKDLLEKITKKTLHLNQDFHSFFEAKLKCIEIKKTSFDLVNLLKRLVQHKNLAADLSKVSIEVFCQYDCLIVNNDSILFEELLQNLTDLCLNNSEPDSTLTFSLLESEKQIQIKLKGSSLNLSEEVKKSLLSQVSHNENEDSFTSKIAASPNPFNAASILSNVKKTEDEGAILPSFEAKIANALNIQLSFLHFRENGAELLLSFKND